MHFEIWAFPEFQVVDVIFSDTWLSIEKIGKNSYFYQLKISFTSLILSHKQTVGEALELFDLKVEVLRV